MGEKKGKRQIKKTPVRGLARWIVSEKDGQETHFLFYVFLCGRLDCAEKIRLEDALFSHVRKEAQAS
jgi:hypothetical protein